MSEMTTVQISTAAQTGSSSTKKQAEKPSGDFMAVLDNMTQSNVSEDTAAQIEETQQSDEEEATKRGGEMMAELLVGTPAGQQLLEAMAEGGENPTAEAGAIAGAGEELLQAVQPEVLEEAPEELLSEGADATVAEIAGPSEQAEESSDMDFLMFQHKFQQSVQEAQKNLRSQPKQENLQELDIESLQADVTMQRFAPEPISVNSEMSLEAQTQNIIDQLDTGIKEHITLGDSEFVMQLKPEGLGEITVRMVESEGKILLSILTSSGAVARALSAESASLQNVLRPMQAEIQEISAMPEYAADQQQFDFTQNSFMDRRQFGGHSRENTPRTFADGPVGNILDSAPAIPTVWGADTGLDAYI